MSCCSPQVLKNGLRKKNIFNFFKGKNEGDTVLGLGPYDLHHLFPPVLPTETARAILLAQPAAARTRCLRRHSPTPCLPSPTPPSPALVPASPHSHVLLVLSHAAAAAPTQRSLAPPVARTAPPAPISRRPRTNPTSVTLDCLNLTPPGSGYSSSLPTGREEWRGGCCEGR